MTEFCIKDQELNRLFLNTFTYTSVGATFGLLFSLVMKRPKFWATFFGGVGSCTAYNESSLQFRSLPICPYLCDLS